MYNVRQISAVCERVGSFFCKGTAKPRMRATTAGGDIRSIYLFRVNVKGSGPRTERRGASFADAHVRVSGSIVRHLSSNHKTSPALNVKIAANTQEVALYQRR